MGMAEQARANEERKRLLVACGSGFDDAGQGTKKTKGGVLLLGRSFGYVMCVAFPPAALACFGRSTGERIVEQDYYSVEQVEATTPDTVDGEEGCVF